VTGGRIESVLPEALSDDVYAEVLDRALSDVASGSDFSADLEAANAALANQAAVQADIYNGAAFWKHVDYPGPSKDFGGCIDRGATCATMHERSTMSRTNRRIGFEQESRRSYSGMCGGSGSNNSSSAVSGSFSSHFPSRARCSFSSSANSAATARTSASGLSSLMAK